jgi:molybdopterin-binding protein
MAIHGRTSASQEHDLRVEGAWRRARAGGVEAAGATAHTGRVSPEGSHVASRDDTPRRRTRIRVPRYDVANQRREPGMQLSARNQLKGTIKSLKTGEIMAEVLLDVAGQELVAEITKSSVERLQLKTGDQVTAIIKATHVMLGK